MKSLSIGACVAVLGASALTINIVNRQPKQTPTGNVDSRLSGDAAFRDGLYQSKLDAEAGRRWHLTTGRWSADQDRRSFVLGYLAGRSQTGSVRATADPAASPATAEEIGYRDGIADGTQDLRSCQPFHLQKKDNYLQAKNGHSEKDGDQDHHELLYRDAYAEGYQEAYYGLPDACSR